MILPFPPGTGSSVSHFCSLLQVKCLFYDIDGKKSSVHFTRILKWMFSKSKNYVIFFVSANSIIDKLLKHFSETRKLVNQSFIEDKLSLVLMKDDFENQEKPPFYDTFVFLGLFFSWIKGTKSRVTFK